MRILSKGANLRLWKGKGDELEGKWEERERVREMKKAKKSSFKKLKHVFIMVKKCWHKILSKGVNN